MTWIKIWTVLFAFISYLPWVAESVTIMPCPLVARENTQTVVTCSGIDSTDTVYWTRSLGGSYTRAGVCAPLPDACISRFPSIMELSRRSSDVSTLTIKNTTRALFSGAAIMCETQTSSVTELCLMDVMYPADVTSCTITPVRSDTKWTVSGSCTISKVFSSRGDYFCQIHLQKQGTPGDITTGVKTPYTPTLSDEYASGMCSYSATLPVDRATYIYTVVVSPGDTSKTAGSINVAAPSADPTINCRHSGGQYIPENTALDCTCTASDLGQPQGRLVGYHDNTLLLQGQYGASSLTLPTVTASRQKGQVTVRCDVDWITSDAQNKSNTFTAPVAYHPTSVEMTLNSRSGPLVVNESQKQDVEFVCMADGRPTPNLQLVADSGREIAMVTGGTLGDTETVLRHTLPAVRGEDSANYSCLATNDLGQKTSDSLVLFVRYPPKVKPGSVSKYRDSLPYINYRGSQTKVTFDLLAYPIPNKVSYLHLGLDLADQGGLPPRIGVFRLLCRNTSNLYTFTCDIVVDDVTSNDIGVYNVTFENEMGSTTMTILVDLYGVETTDTTEVPRFDRQDKDGADDALSFGAGVGVGIVVGVACMMGVGAVTVVLWRRKGRMSNNTGSTTLPVTSMSSPEAMTEEEANETRDYSESMAAGPYESLRLKDVGQRSLYEDLHKKTGVCETSNRTGGGATGRELHQKKESIEREQSS